MSTVIKTSLAEPAFTRQDSRGGASTAVRTNLGGWGERSCQDQPGRISLVIRIILAEVSTAITTSLAESTLSCQDQPGGVGTAARTSLTEPALSCQDQPGRVDAVAGNSLVQPVQFRQISPRGSLAGRDTPCSAGSCCIACTNVWLLVTNSIDKPHGASTTATSF